jgi:phosphoglucosamine mutase
LLRFGTDGVRGVALTELTTDYVRCLGAAAASVIDGGIWLVGRDTRESGEVIEAALLAGLRSRGQHAESCGVLPTPALAFLSAQRGVPAAMVTASHNPFTDNGVKIFAAGGVKLNDATEGHIEAELERLVTHTSLSELPTHAQPVVADAVAEYVAHVAGLFPAGALAGLRVVLDCANGAMSTAAPAVVRALGAETIVMHASPNGRNINAECGATHPASLAAAVLDHRADAGLAFDGDGDRVIAIDNHGHVVDGDRLIALGALQLQAEGGLTGNAVVVTVMSNLGFHRAMQAAGIDVIATAVGDRYVLEALDNGDYAIGGEQSGHVIYRHLATTGDGLLAGVRLLSFVNSTARSLAVLSADVMTTFPQVLVNVRVDKGHPDIATELAADIVDAENSLGGDGRVLVRASGTEPLVRVMVEAPTDALAGEVAERLAALVRARFGSSAR